MTKRVSSADYRSSLRMEIASFHTNGTLLILVFSIYSSLSPTRQSMLRASICLAYRSSISVFSSTRSIASCFWEFTWSDQVRCLHALLLSICSRLVISIPKTRWIIHHGDEASIASLSMKTISFTEQESFKYLMVRDEAVIRSEKQANTSTGTNSFSQRNERFVRCFLCRLWQLAWSSKD